MGLDGSTSARRRVPLVVVAMLCLAVGACEVAAEVGEGTASTASPTAAAGPVVTTTVPPTTTTGAPTTSSSPPISVPSTTIAAPAEGTVLAVSGTVSHNDDAATALEFTYSVEGDFWVHEVWTGTVVTYDATGLVLELTGGGVSLRRDGIPSAGPDPDTGLYSWVGRYLVGMTLEVLGVVPAGRGVHHRRRRVL